MENHDIVRIVAFLKCSGVPSDVFYFLECFSTLIGFINIYTLSTNRNKYNMHCCRMSTVSIDVLEVSSAA